MESLKPLSYIIKGYFSMFIIVVFIAYYYGIELDIINALLMFVGCLFFIFFIDLARKNDKRKKKKQFLKRVSSEKLDERTKLTLIDHIFIDIDKERKKI